MKKILLLITMTMVCLRTGAVIFVNPTSTGNSPFDAIPAVTNWSTVLVSGVATDVIDAAGLDAAVQLLSASGITTVLGSSGTTPPSISTVARFNTTGQYLQTRPTHASTKMNVLMTSLQNNSGSNLAALTISYTLGLEYTNNPVLGEEVAGYRVYYSFTGNANDWVVIPDLSVPLAIASTNRLRATVNLGSWTTGSTLYLLWADDNGSGADTGAVAAEGAYTIDNFSATPISNPISFGVTGTATRTFGEFPTETHWSTFTSAGGAGDIPDTNTLDLAVQTVAATNIGVALATSVSINPPTASLFARWNGANFDVQTRTTGARALALMATLRNDTANSVGAVTISYNFVAEVEAASTIDEQIPGQRVYYSLTGTPGSWQLIPGLSVSNSAALSVSLVLAAPWTSGSLLYILWADDNGTGGTTPPGALEGAYHFDNFVVEPAVPGVAITSPDAGATFPQGVPISISAATLMTGTATNVDFFQNGNLIASDSTPPFNTVYSNATLGAHSLTATAKDDLGNTANSTAVNITVVANNPPTVTITNPPSGSNYFVGTIANIMASASDTDGSVVRVEFYVDGTFLTQDASSPYAFDLGDITAGAHTVSAVAVDNGGFRGTNSISITGTNPPGIVSFLITNGSSWKYLDDGSDQDTSGWQTFAFNDSGWSNGIAELGYGDAPGRPERTTVGFGTNASAKFATTYFRKSFNVADVDALGALDLRVLADDHFVVYINNTVVFTDITLPIYHTNYVTPDIAHDGAVYTNLLVNKSVLNTGANIIAVEVHQSSAGSSDISFDLMLWGVAGAGPLLRPSINGTNFTVTWNGGGTLYQSTNLNSPSNWTAIPGATSPFVTNTAAPIRFFRVLVP